MVVHSDFAQSRKNRVVIDFVTELIRASQAERASVAGLKQQQTDYAGMTRTAPSITPIPAALPTATTSIRFERHR